MDGEGGAFGYVKKHPMMIAGAVVAFVLLLFVIRRAGSSNGSASAGPDLSGLYASAAASSQQQASLNAQLAGEQIQADSAKDIATLQAGISAMNIYGQTVTTYQGQQLAADTASKNIDAELQASNNSLTATVANITAQLAGLENTNASQVAITGIQANEQTAIAATNADTLKTEISSFADVTKTQIKSNEAVTTQYLKHGSSSSGFGAIASLASAVFG